MRGIDREGWVRHAGEGVFVQPHALGAHGGFQRAVSAIRHRIVRHGTAALARRFPGEDIGAGDLGGVMQQHAFLAAEGNALPRHDPFPEDGRVVLLIEELRNQPRPSAIRHRAAAIAEDRGLAGTEHGSKLRHALPALALRHAGGEAEAKAFGPAAGTLPRIRDQPRHEFRAAALVGGGTGAVGVAAEEARFQPQSVFAPALVDLQPHIARGDEVVGHAAFDEENIANPHDLFAGKGRFEAPGPQF